MLGRKQCVRSNEEWLAAYDGAIDSVSPERTAMLTEQAIARITAMNGLRCCNGWIAGKDSIVVQDLVSKSGIRCTPIIWRGVNEYPAMTEWIERNRPEGLVESVIERFTLDYIERNPGFLFCQGGNDYRQRWMAEKWRRQRLDLRGFDVLITGRRILDGNQCGSAVDGFVRGKALSPIADWTHEDLLAYIRRNGIELPPFYSWPRGFLLGSVAMGEWTERPAMGLTAREVWDELHEIDASIVEGAAGALSSARDYLEGRLTDDT